VVPHVAAREAHKRSLKLSYFTRKKTFATISALFGHGAMSAIAPLSGVKRKWHGHHQTDVIDPERTFLDLYQARRAAFHELLAVSQC